MNQPLLRIEDLYLSFKTRGGNLYALNGINLSVETGEIFGVVGETGCGKTITGLSILQLLPDSASISSGQIYFEEVDLLALPKKEIRHYRGGKISMIFQDPSSALNPVFSIGQQFTKIVREHLPLNRQAAREHIVAMLKAVGLPDVQRVLNSYPHQLSGGMQQRVMIALALACNPTLLIADEPTTALDVTIQAQILSLLKDLQKQYGFSVILITHNLGVVAKMCDRLAVLYAGRVVETGTARQIFEDPRHPYTRGLLHAIPRADRRGTQMATIPGNVPSNPGLVAGCAFAPRCEFAFDRCRSESPAASSPQSGHKIACFLEERIG